MAGLLEYNLQVTAEHLLWPAYMYTSNSWMFAVAGLHVYNLQVTAEHLLWLGYLYTTYK